MMTKGENFGPCPVAVAKTSKTLAKSMVLATASTKLIELSVDVATGKGRSAAKCFAPNVDNHPCSPAHDPLSLASRSRLQNR